MTNREFLQDMDNYDLAEFLGEIIDCDNCMCKKECVNSGNTCTKNIMNWLKSQSEDQN